MKYKIFQIFLLLGDYKKNLKISISRKKYKKTDFCFCVTIKKFLNFFYWLLQIAAFLTTDYVEYSVTVYVQESEEVIQTIFEKPITGSIVSINSQGTCKINSFAKCAVLNCYVKQFDSLNTNEKPIRFLGISTPCNTFKDLKV